MTNQLTNRPSLVVTRAAWFIMCLIALMLTTVTPVSAEAATGRLAGIYEPSGIEQSGSVVLIIEDEKEQALHRLTGWAKGKLPATQVLQKCGTGLDDLEGITADGEYFYLAGSHQPKSDGNRRKKRELFIRLKVQDTSCEELAIAPSLYKALQAALDRFTGQQAKKPFQVNIESLAWKPDTNQLYVGLRQPLLEKKSILLTLDNPKEIFDKQAQPAISAAPVLLELGNAGIRAMSYIDDLGGYLIANETGNSDTKKQSTLWFWPGEKTAPYQLNIAEIRELKNIEGLSALQHNGQRFVILVCDDGSMKKKKGAHFAIIPMSVLKKAIHP